MKQGSAEAAVDKYRAIQSVSHDGRTAGDDRCTQATALDGPATDAEKRVVQLLYDSKTPLQFQLHQLECGNAGRPWLFAGQTGRCRRDDKAAITMAVY